MPRQIDLFVFRRPRRNAGAVDHYRAHAQQDANQCDEKVSAVVHGEIDSLEETGLLFLLFVAPPTAARPFHEFETGTGQSGCSHLSKPNDCP